MFYLSFWFPLFSISKKILICFFNIFKTMLMCTFDCSFNPNVMSKFGSARLKNCLPLVFTIIEYIIDIFLLTCLSCGHQFNLIFNFNIGIFTVLYKKSLPVPKRITNHLQFCESIIIVTKTAPLSILFYIDSAISWWRSPEKSNFHSSFDLNQRKNIAKSSQE